MAFCCDSDPLPPAIQYPRPRLCVTSSCRRPTGSKDAPSMHRAGKQPVSGKGGRSERCQFGRAAQNYEQRFLGEQSIKLPSFWVYNRQKCSMLYLQELALQEAANYMSHLNLFIRLKQSTFQSDAQNVSKIIPGQKCKCVRFLMEQIKTKHHTGTTPRFPPPHGIRLTDLVHVVRLNICSSTKLPLCYCKYLI